MTKVQSVIYPRFKKSNLEAIGRVSATWSILESFLMDAIAKLARIPADRCAALITPSSFQGWTDMLQRLVALEAFPDAIQKSVKKLCDNLNSLMIERNKVVHAYWLMGQPPGQRKSRKTMAVTFPKRGKKVMQFEQKTPAQMHELADRMERILIELVALPDRLLPPLPENTLARLAREAQPPPDDPSEPQFPPTPSGD